MPKRKNIITSSIGGWLTLSGYVSLSKNVYKTIKKANKYANKGGIAIFDRYPQIVFPGINDGPKIRNNYIPKSIILFLKNMLFSVPIKKKKT